MTAMVERVARAICCPNSKCWADEKYAAEIAAGTHYGTRLPCATPAHLDDARAAIAAMREPTEEMAEAGLRVGAHSDPEAPVREWRAMIDAALGPHPHTTAAAATPAASITASQSGR